MKLLIGLSYAPQEQSKYQKYTDALKKAAKYFEYDVEVVNLATDPEKVHTIDGIIFTGGADVEPVLYGKPELTEQCDEIDKARDILEFSLAKTTDERAIPVFGICRGLQLLNVHHGGTLIADLPTAGFPSHSKIPQPDGTKIDRTHSVTVEAGTLLKRITRVLEADIASAHHQAIDELAPGMTISSRSGDDERIIEAIEWKEPENHPYFLAVQWHPERMNLDSPLSAPLFESFIEAVAMKKILASRM